MPTRRLPLVIGTLALVATSGMLALVEACGSDGLGDDGPHQNGCIGNACYDYDANPGTDNEGGGAEGGADGAIVYGNPLDGITNLTATLVKGGFVFPEGPVWVGSRLLFSDTGQNTIFSMADDGTTTMFRTMSGGANGNAIDKQGHLYTCEGNRGRVTRTDTSLANPVAFADAYNGKPFDSPNDIIVRADGNVYFTDPFYGMIPDGGLPQDKQAVYHVAPNAPDTKSAQRLAFDFNKANGIALSPDGTALYVVDNGAGKVMAAHLMADGTLDGTFAPLLTTPTGDGICVDLGGNLYVATMTGVMVFSSAGASLGTIKVTGTPSNVAFGGSDHKTLYITAQSNGGAADPNSGIYSIALKNPGNP